MFKSPYPDEVIPAVSVFDFLFSDLGADDASKVAMVDGTNGTELTYQQLVGQTLAVAGAIAARGVTVGDVVALHCPNVPAFAPVFHGILRAGAACTPVNALYTADEITTQLRDSGAKMIFTVSPLLAQAEAAAVAAGLDPSMVVVLDGAEGHPSLRDLLTEQAPAPEVSFDPATHVAVLPYSSGTTGIPKGVMLSHTNLVANVVQVRAVLDVTKDDVVLALLPFTHIYGMTVLLNIAFKKRAKLVTMPRFDLTEFLRIIQDYGCTYLFIAPPIAVALTKHPLVDQYDLSTVRAMLSGAAPLDSALAEALSHRLHTRVRQGYGMTETSPVSHVMPPDNEGISLGSVGFPVANVEAKIMDVATGNEITEVSGMSEPGELWLRGPNIMLGYLNREDATREMLDADGFLHTGDIATVDEHGAFYIVDRLKELIKYKGHQVAPAELEALLLTHPEIADAAVVGALDEEGQEVPKAFVVKTPDSTLDEAGVMDFVAGHVAAHKKIRQVSFIEVVPKSSSGKILRKDLKGK